MSQSFGDLGDRALGDRSIGDRSIGDREDQPGADARTAYDIPAADSMASNRKAFAEIDVLRRQYFALVPPYLLRMPSTTSLRFAQGVLVRELLNGSECPPQPEAGYRKLFWKRVLGEVERAFQEEQGDDEDEVDEGLYEAVAEAMAVPASETGMPAPSPKTFIYTSLAERRITLHEEQVAVQAGSTGLRTWTAALHFAHHFLSDPVALFGRNVSAVVELGAGTGFLSAVLALEGVDVIATDLGDGNEDGHVEAWDDEGGNTRQTPLGRLTANLITNNLPVPALPLDWADAALPPPDRPEQWPQVLAPVAGRRRDIIAADVIYDPDIVPLLVAAIRVLLTEDAGGDTPVAVVSATVRNPDTFKLFLDTCSTVGLETTLLPLQPMDPENPTFWDTGMDRGTTVEIVRIRAVA